MLVAITNIVAAQTELSVMHSVVSVGIIDNSHYPYVPNGMARTSSKIVMGSSDSLCTPHKWAGGDASYATTYLECAVDVPLQSDDLVDWRRAAVHIPAVRVADHGAFVVTPMLGDERISDPRVGCTAAAAWMPTVLQLAPHAAGLARPRCWVGGAIAVQSRANLAALLKALDRDAPHVF